MSSAPTPRALQENRPAGYQGPSQGELHQAFCSLRRLEWWTVVSCLSIVGGFLLISGNSQVMRTELMENLFALVPVIGALATVRFENRPQDASRPFGYHRMGTVAFTAGTFTLAAVGTFLFVENALKLLHQEYPSMGGFQIFGQVVWHGWVMIGAMAVAIIPSVVLSHLKMPLAKLVHDKAVFADAEMNRANWLSNGAGIIGLLLVAWGHWWGDAAAALLISLDIMRDGYTNTLRSLSDVMDHHPVDIEEDRQLPLVAEIKRTVRKLPWVKEEVSLIREHGRMIFAEIFVAPSGEAPPAVEATRQVREAVTSLDWRLAHVAVELTDNPQESSAVATLLDLERN